MSSHSTLSPAQIRASLKHPIVDGDGHWMETPAVLAEYLCDVAGPALTDKYIARQKQDLRWYQASDAERLQKRYRRQNWWSFPSTTLDNATFRLPRLLHQRLPEMGIDFSVVYPTLGLFMEGLADTDLRLAACRAYNTMVADLFKPYADRLTPVAIVPRLTPGEAVAEATHAVRNLGLKAIMVSGTMRRPGAKGVPYVEALGLDNQDNYDPFWQTCVDLKVAVTSHAGSITWPDRVSVTNYTYNHIGHFAQGNHTFAKAVWRSNSSYSCMRSSAKSRNWTLPNDSEYARRAAARWPTRCTCGSRSSAASCPRARRPSRPLTTASTVGQRSRATSTMGTCLQTTTGWRTRSVRLPPAGRTGCLLDHYGQAKGLQRS